jgi:hypothetical protein
MKLQKNKDSKGVQDVKATDERTMSRKEAIRKTGYIALSAATMMLLLSKPENTQAQSSPASLPTTPWP